MQPLFRAALLLSLVAGGPVTAQTAGVPVPPDKAAGLFGARPIVQHLSLSPDGTRIALIGPLEGRGQLLAIGTVGATGAMTPIFKSTGDPQAIDSCWWTSNSRLFCRAYAAVGLEIGVTYVSRYFSINADGSDFKMLEPPRGTGQQLGYNLYGGNVIDWLPDQENQVLMLREYRAEQGTGTRLAQSKEGMGVDQVNTVDFGRRQVEQPKPEARDFITDGNGVVRIKSEVALDPDGYDRGAMRYFYRKKGSREWELLSELQGAEAFAPYGVDAETDVVYGLKSLNGRLAAYSRSLDGSGTETLLYANPDVDVDGFVEIGRKRKVIGASYVTDKRQTFFFDPAIARLITSLSKALPNLPKIEVMDSSQDGNRLLLWAGSDTDPGRYFVFDRTGRQLMELTSSRPWLEGAALAAMKPVSYPARDGVQVLGYLSLPAGSEGRKLPAVVLPHGGPGARDEWGFDWLAQFFVSQGYAVLQPNFRGSSGYGDAWFQQNGFQGWQTAIGDVNDAGRWLVAQGIADPAKLSIVGWSYGGYAALQSQVVEPDLFKHVVAIAPVTDLDLFRDEKRAFTSFQRRREFIGTGPHIEAGSPARHAGAFKAPVLLFHGSLDSNVAVRESQLMADRLKAAGKPVQLVVFDKLDHYLDDGNARTAMLTQIGDFLKQS